MTWLWTIIAAVLTGLACGGATFWLMTFAVRWFRIPSMEGQSGYAVVFMAIYASIGGLVVGFIAARIGVGLGWESFIEQIIFSVTTGLILVGIAGVIARCLADVPPKLESHELNVQLEFRLPASQKEKPNLPDEQVALKLGSRSTFPPEVRNWRFGDFHFDQARFEDEHWIVPGDAPVFTARGRRVLLVTLGDKEEEYKLALPRHPKKKHRSWSDWQSELESADSVVAEPLSYRYRVVNRA